MSQTKKHIGKVVSTEQRCVVVFMQIPDAPERALIINSEALPERLEQILMEVVMSTEGQASNDLGTILDRRLVQDTGRTVLAEFHARGLMRAEPIDNIVMLPRPNQPFPLRTILVELGKLNGTTIPVKAVDEDAKFNQHQQNQNANVSDERTNTALNLLAEAEMLQDDANRKREQAYSYAPHLRPAAVVTPDPIVETKPARKRSAS